MNVQPLSLRGLREQVVLAQCEAFAVMLALGEMKAGRLGTEARPAAGAPLEALPGGARPEGRPLAVS